MKQRKSRKWVGLVLTVLLLILTGVSIEIAYRQSQQEQLNRTLIVAIKKNDRQSVVSLLAQGADANARDVPSDTRPFWRIFLDRVRNRPPQSSAPTTLLIALGSTGDGKDSHVFSPDEEIIQDLLKHGADVNVKDAKGRTPLILAANLFDQYANERTLKLLLDRGADINARDAEGRTALDTALNLGWKRSVALLLQYKPNVNLKDKYGYTALTHAVKTGNLALIKMLLDNGADIKNRDQDGTPTLLAVFSEGKDVPNSPQVVSLLLDRGANINVMDGGGETLLMSASAMGIEEIVRILIKRGANLNLKSGNDRDGETALALARRALRDDKNEPYYNAKGLVLVIQLLKKAGEKE